MLDTRRLKLSGRDAGLLYSLCNKGIDVAEFCLTDIDSIDTAQHIDAICHRFPVKGHIVLDI